MKSQNTKTKLNKIQKDLKNMQRDNNDIEMQLARVLMSKLSPAVHVAAPANVNRAMQSNSLIKSNSAKRSHSLF